MSPPKYSLWSVGGVLPPITVATSPIFFHCQCGGIGQGASGGEGESSGRMARARSLSSSANRSFSAIGRLASLRRSASLLLTISSMSNPMLLLVHELSLKFVPALTKFVSLDNRFQSL